MASKATPPAITTAVSLFAGVGGFDLALERNGISVVASVEIDPFARGVLQRHFPNSTIFNDVQEVTGEQLIQAGFDPAHGVIAGGSPCQNFSIAGKRAGLAGKQSGLFWDFHRLLEETKAQYFIFENVPGLLSSHGGADFGAILGSLVNLGYGISYRILDAQFYGLAARRKRVFIVGSLGDPGGSSARVLALAEGHARYLEEISRKASRASLSAKESARGNSASEVTSPGIETSTQLPVPLAFHMKQNPISGSISPALGVTSDGMGVAYDEYNGTISPIHHALRSGTVQSTGVLVDRIVRRLTEIECERVMGFPDEWTKYHADGSKQTKGHRYKQMGNAVAVPVAEWIIARLVEEANSHPVK
jgi:DNA (cytosine-5)-methyltransferase 1